MIRNIEKWLLITHLFSWLFLAHRLFFVRRHCDHLLPPIYCPIETYWKKCCDLTSFFHEIEKRSKPFAVIWKICKYLSRNTFSSWVLIFVNSSSTCFSRSLSIKWLLSVSALEFAISLALSRTFSTWVARSSFSLTSRNCSWFSLTSEASLASISSLSWSNWWLRTRSLPLRSAISSCASVRLLARPIREKEHL